MNLTEGLLLFFSILSFIPTIASLTRFDEWWVRGFDFPRVQTCFLIVLIYVIVFFTVPLDSPWHYVILIMLGINFTYQAVKIYPFTILAKKQVFRFKGHDPQNTISVLVSNVLTTNKKYNLLQEQVHKKQPDLLLTLESDENWERELAHLEEEYTHTVKIPKDNLYGMHLYSRLELQDIEIKYLISEEIPSIHGFVKLRNGERVKIHCLHPKPPSPTEDSTSTNRDAELLIVGKDADADHHSVLVFGDLNDVAWSRTTRLFRKISGLLDPRIGRGFYNTFHASYPIFRWPLDHIFHSNDFTLIELHRLPNIGSDHFPMYIKLNYEPRAELIQEEPEEANGEEKEWAEEKIDNADPLDEDL